jgi:hypothetical protein
MILKTAKEKKLKRLINNYVNASIAKSWMGGGDPEDWPAIERRYKDAKKKLYDFVKQLTYVDHTPQAYGE